MATIRQPDVYFASPPLWSNEMGLKRSYRTNIMTAMAGDEQRSGINTKVRRELTYSIQCKSAAQTNYVKRRVMKYQHLIWGVPIWPYEMLVVSGGYIGSTELVVDDASSRELKTTMSDEIILTDGYSSFESKDISSIVSNTITLSSALILAWAANKTVFPVLRAELSDVQEFKLDTPEHNSFSFIFTESFRNIDS